MSALLAFVGVVIWTVCVGVLAYTRGYKAGVAYCMAQLEPVREAAIELARTARPG
jgi:hypothetical protein